VFSRVPIKVSFVPDCAAYSACQTTYTRDDSFVQPCPAGYSRSHSTELINPPNMQCYSDTGSD